MSLAEAPRARGPRRPLRTRTCLAAAWLGVGLLPESAMAVLDIAEALSAPWIRPRSAIFAPPSPSIRAPSFASSLRPCVPPLSHDVRNPEAIRSTPWLRPGLSAKSSPSRIPESSCKKGLCSSERFLGRRSSDTVSLAPI